ncbi:MAG TPA: alpha/beta fold hydrolase [Alphaproteobacteria bacterium]|nr:alpha/beta fold hydrolase [Alphaproteobacteria bacterium]
MKLVFIHGWGLTPGFWDDVASRLSEFRHHRIDLGFFGPPSLPANDDEPSILIGHSLGFVHGLSTHQNWRGWVAVNSFPRFLKTKTQPGCSSAAELRDIRIRLENDPHQTLKDFHGYIGARTPAGEAQAERLREALDFLRDGDASAVLETLAAPGLVLASKNDPLVPAETSAALAEGRSIEWHDKGGHVLPQNDPNWCAESIRLFVASHA